MSAIPSHLARVPNALTAQILSGSLTRTSQDLLRAQIQIATGKAVNSPSDDSVAASAISVFDDLIERRDQRLRNLTHAEAVLNNLDAALGDASGLLLDAKSVGLSQIGIGSDPDTRENQALVIDAILDEMISIANRKYQLVHFFGGSATANPPIADLLGGLQYVGEGDGLETDLGMVRGVPITVSAEDAFGAMSTRVEGDHDLDPTMTTATRLADLNGARGLGITLGTINVDVNGTDLTVDLSDAHTIGDVISTLEAAIQTVDPAATVTIDAATDNRLEITPTLGPITISDPVGDATAADLGINTTFIVGGGIGNDLDPKLTELTPVANLTGVTVPLGTIRLSNGGQVRDLDLSGAQNVQDIMNAVAALQIGVRVEIAEAGDRLNFVNELSGNPDTAMSIAEIGGGATATELGVRSFTDTTLLADFNHGLGVSYIDGSIDPVTGLPDPTADIDFRVTLLDGRTFDVDLDETHETTLDVINEINAAAAGSGLAVPAEFEVALAADGNGFEFTDNTVAIPGGEFSITALNGSNAPNDLGILGSTTSAIFTGEDRATVAVESVFSHLIALRDALAANDERGISIATEKLEGDISRVAEARAEVGVRSQRVADAAIREEDLRLQDMNLRSELQDLDFTEASIRFAQLQQQLQAGITAASQVTRLSLLDFLL